MMMFLSCTCRSRRGPTAPFTVQNTFSRHANQILSYSSWRNPPVESLLPKRKKLSIQYFQLPQRPTTEGPSGQAQLLSFWKIRDKVNDLKASIGPLSGRSSVYCTEACLRRYLRARNWNVAKSKKMLEETLNWRSTYKPEEIPWHEVSTEGETGKAYRAAFQDKEDWIQPADGRDSTINYPPAMTFPRHASGGDTTINRRFISGRVYRRRPRSSHTASIWID
ncbi:hypothetical protein AXF42_Ash020662 [Apostasia shenzhenica]|uniref:CRAL/TRIO N-terminal domain-containing protein n=1 Tax=Apostasia shenzhenica TaxID=1088818 RepID=A0A2H9ZW46_9ASPA|nr:hypothetical protein AXF42_Ash020662 [Apostasia shenzhenica]